MPKLKVNVGDEFKTKREGNIYAKETIKIKKVENADSDDGWAYFDTKELIHRRKYNHRARIWWFRKFCIRIKKASEEND